MPEKVKIPSRHWSADHEDMLEESSHNHYLDVASRKNAIRSLSDRLSRPNAAYLEAGCSTGWLLDDVRRTFPGIRSIGADAILAGLRKIRGRGSTAGVPSAGVSDAGRSRDACLAQFDLCRAPFADQRFDAISCVNVLEHIEEDIQAMREIRRMLKPDGRAFLMVPACPGLYDYFDEVHQHVRRYDRTEFRDKLRLAGFDIVRENYMGTVLFPPFFVVKKIGQWKMKGKSLEEKRHHVMKNLSGGGAGGGPIGYLGALAMAVDWQLGRCFSLPFGIRLFALVERSGS